MLDELLAHLNNYFTVPGGSHEGTFTVVDGGITLPFLQPGQYFRVVGSVFNGGVHCYPENTMVCETFSGTIHALAVPSVVISISEEIDEWIKKYGDSPYSSESFGGYSYQRSLNKGGVPLTWQDVFAKQLNRWRKL